MNDEQMRPLLKAWFRARSVAPGDVPDGVAQVVARLPQTQQRSRWWPLPGFDRSAPNPTTNGRQPARGFTMFGALKFVVASAILALFGGFLLGGILMTQQGDEMAPAAVTASPSPTTTSDLLSGMVTEEVEPGVYKVVNDGVHSLSPMFQGRVVAGHDGVMYLHLDDGFYRLGDDEMHAWPVRVSGEADDGFAHTIMEVAPNGTVWALLHDGSSDEYSFHSFDGDMWTAHSGSPSDLDVSPSGTVWTVDQDQDDRWVVRFTGDEGASWRTLERIPPSDDAWDNAWLDVADGSDVWTGGLWGLWGPWHYADGTWQAYEQYLGTKADGTFWTVGWDEHYQEERLYRSDGAGTRDWSLAELGLDRNPEDMALADMRVAPDGSLWFGWWERLERPQGGGYDEPPVVCVGVIRFDGLDLRRYALPSTPDGYDCFDGMDATADGSLWLTMGDDLYVITAEAVAVKETEAAKASSAEEASDMEEASTTTSDLLSGMVTEEVEPGVFRVVNDGVRDISYPVGPWGLTGFIVDVTPDGNVWFSANVGSEGLYRLGAEPVSEAIEGYPHYREVAPDGSLWAIGEVSDEGRGIYSFDGERWTARATPTDDVYALAVGPDGTVWVAGDAADKHCPDIESEKCWGNVLLRLEDDGSLTTIEDWAGVYDGDVNASQTAVSPDGDVWLVGTQRGYGQRPDMLLRFDGEGWEAIPGPEGWNPGGRGRHRYLDFGPDGTLWVKADVAGGLARFDDPGWTTFTEADGVEPWGKPWGDPSPFTGGLLDVAANGSLWLLGSQTDESCGGVGHYDGTSWTPYLTEHCVHHFAIAPDGSVWLGAGYLHRPNHLYVITPEAVAASE